MKFSQHLLRFAIAAATGCAVSFIAIAVAWMQLGQEWRLNQRQHSTRETLASVGEAIEEYRQESGSLPVSLSDLRSDDKPISIIESHEESDGWRRPLMYSVEGTNYTVTSFGRDGKPGGVGLDCDLSQHAPNPALAFPTLSQFVFDLPSQGIVATCWVTGLLAAFLAWLLAKPAKWTRQTAKELAGRLLATVIGSVIVGVFLAGEHLPTGH